MPNRLICRSVSGYAPERLNDAHCTVGRARRLRVAVPARGFVAAADAGALADVFLTVFAGAGRAVFTPALAPALAGGDFFGALLALVVGPAAPNAPAAMHSANPTPTN